MPDPPSRSPLFPPEGPPSLPGLGDSAAGDRQAALAKVIARRPGVSWWLGVVLALAFAAVVTPTVTAERWLLGFHPGSVAAARDAPFTVRAPMLAGYDTLRIRGGVVVARGEVATREEATIADAIADALPRGPMLYLALFALSFVLAAIFTHHMRRSNKGRLVRVQVVSLGAIALLAIAAKVAMSATALSALVVPVAVLAIVPTMALDRIVGLATGVLGALVISLLTPFDVGVAILLLVQAATAGLVIGERPRRRWPAALGAGLAATLCTIATYVLLTYLTTGQAPELRDPLHSAWLAAAFGPALAAVISVPLLPLYQLAVGEITRSRLFALEDLGHPLLRQIAERAPGTWQHSLMMANMAEIAANAIGASGRLVRVGAYFHDLGKSLSPKYFIENLEPGESSPHDQLPPEVSCDAIFAHVTAGIVAARKAGLHERIVDFMHMHHGDGVLEYFWAKCREQGNPEHFTIDRFRYPGHPPQSRETALLAICDAVEAASRTLKKPDPAAIDALVQRIVYGKLHLGQLDESGLSMSDLRRISDSLRETIRHANHGRIEYPWQKAGQDASASVMSVLSASPRLDSLDRKPARDSGAPSSPSASDAALAALAATADVKQSADAPRAPLAAAAPAEAVRIRAGTARNAHPNPTDAGIAGGWEAHAVSDADASAPRRAVPESERSGRTTEPARPGPLREATARGTDELGRPPARDPIARGTDQLGRPIRAVEPSSPAEPAHTPARGVTTLPGRAPGPSLPEALAPDDDPPQSRDRTTLPPPTVLAPPRAATDASAPDPAAARKRVATLPPPQLSPPPDLITPQTFTAEGSSSPEAIARPPTAELPAPAARKRAATLPPAQLQVPPRRQPTPAPPIATHRAPTSAAGTAHPAPSPIAAHRAPTAPPADPMQLAAALASTISAAGTAPFNLAPPDPARSTTPPPSADEIHGAVTQPLLPASTPPRTSGLADDRQRSRPIHTLQGVGEADEPITLRRRASTADGPPAPRPPAEIADDARVTIPRIATRPQGDDDPRVTDERPSAAPDDAGITEPSMPVLSVGAEPRVDVAPPPGEPSTGWSSGLAARIDAALDSDEWSHETPIVPPSKAELRALLGNPDPTRQQPIDEIEMLQRRAAELGAADPPRRSPHPTAEVDPDDIEAAIELAPPARRATTANAIGVAKPKPKPRPRKPSE